MMSRTAGIRKLLKIVLDKQFGSLYNDYVKAIVYGP